MCVLCLVGALSRRGQNAGSQDAGQVIHGRHERTAPDQRGGKIYFLVLGVLSLTRLYGERVHFLPSSDTGCSLGYMDLVIKVHIVWLPLSELFLIFFLAERDPAADGREGKNGGPEARERFCCVPGCRRSQAQAPMGPDGRPKPDSDQHHAQEDVQLGPGRRFRGGEQLTHNVSPSPIVSNSLGFSVITLFINCVFNSARQIGKASCRERV